MFRSSYQLTSFISIVYSVVFLCYGEEQFQVIAHPKDAAVKIAGNVTLDCKFNKAVKKCVWMEDYFKPVKMGSYNNFVDKLRNGTNTVDCSMIITTFSRAIDATCFYCVGFLNNSINSGIASRKACLLQAAPYVSGDDGIVGNPQDATVEEGDSVTLSCLLNRPALSCAWGRNDRKDPQPILDRYEYISFGKVMATDYADCSIRINQFKAMDAVRWQCYAQVGDAGDVGILKSNWAKLTFIPKVDVSTPGSTCPPTQLGSTTSPSPTKGVTEQLTTGMLSPEAQTQTKTGQYSSMVIIGTLTLVLVLLLTCLQVAVMYFLKYRMQGFRYDTINLPTIEKENLMA